MNREIVDKINTSDIILRDFTEEDIPLKVEWINNPENNKYLHYDIPLSIKGTLKWFRNKDNETRKDYVIEYKNEPVGVIGLLNIDKRNMSAEYYITIGVTKFHNCGIGTQATELLLETAFNVIGIKKIYLNVDNENRKAVRLYKKTGFIIKEEFDEYFNNTRKVVKRIKMEVTCD